MLEKYVLGGERERVRDAHASLNLAWRRLVSPTSLLRRPNFCSLSFGARILWKDELTPEN
jgi:hypothetical protein